MNIDIINVQNMSRKDTKKKLANEQICKLVN